MRQHVQFRYNAQKQQQQIRTYTKWERQIERGVKWTNKQTNKTKITHNKLTLNVYFHSKHVHSIHICLSDAEFLWHRSHASRSQKQNVPKLDMYWSARNVSKNINVQMSLRFSSACGFAICDHQTSSFSILIRQLIIPFRLIPFSYRRSVYS